jgi:hypothetical protein
MQSIFDLKRLRPLSWWREELLMMAACQAPTPVDQSKLWAEESSGAFGTTLHTEMSCVVEPEQHATLH